MLVRLDEVRRWVGVRWRTVDGGGGEEGEEIIRAILLDCLVGIEGRLDCRDDEVSCGPVAVVEADGYGAEWPASM